MSPVSDAKKRAIAKYDDKAYDKFLVRVPKGQKETIQAFAASKGKSLNGFVTDLIREAMERGGKTPPAEEG